MPPGKRRCVFRDPVRAEGSSSPAHVSGRVLSVSRRIARCPREPVPDTRREHGIGRYRGGAARRGVRALAANKQDFSTARSRPNRSAVGIPRGCPPYRVASYARAMLSHARARPIRPIVRGVGGECASRRAFFPRVGDDFGTCCVPVPMEAADASAVLDASRDDESRGLSGQQMVDRVSRRRGPVR